MHVVSIRKKQGLFSCSSPRILYLCAESRVKSTVGSRKMPSSASYPELYQQQNQQRCQQTYKLILILAHKLQDSLHKRFRILLRDVMPTLLDKEYFRILVDLARHTFRKRSK